MFSIETDKGKSIRAHSYFENEDEILLPPGIYLKVIGSLTTNDGLNIIQLREIPPPHEMLVKPSDINKTKLSCLPPNRSLKAAENITSNSAGRSSLKKGKFIVFPSISESL
jgi:hypothetical protein